MSEPASPNGAKGPEIDAPAGQSGVSIPDRRRIDSDVRAFLREPSTPWIVFDQDGRPPSQLAVGEMLEVPRKMLLSDPSFFTATAAIDAIDAAAALSRAEPSSLALASDLTDDDVHTSAGPLDGGATSIPMRGLSRRVIGASVGAFALIATLGIGVLALRSSTTEEGASRHAAATSPAQRSAGASVPAEVPPPDLDLKTPTGSVAAAVPVVAAAPPATGTPSAEAAALAARKYGRLSVAGDARGRDVFMDGKRMLGRGARSFTVLCGPHTIAVGNRTDVRGVEIPCTGSAELMITK